MSDLRDQEIQVLRLIRNNPFAGQQQIADALGLSRSAVAAHVVQLMDKGYILGRGYVVAPEDRVIAIGGAVIDRKYLSSEALIAGTSNPASSLRSFGGVARNVAENLARLGAVTGFISAVGEDEGGHQLIHDLREHHVDVAGVFTLAGATTAEYVAVLEPSGDLAFGIADMAIFDQLTPALLERVWPSIAAARWVFADCNLPAETLARLIERRAQSRFRLAIDAVSTPKVAKLPKDLTGVDLLFMNLDEASACLGRSFPRDGDGMRAAAEALRAAGAAEVVLSCGVLGMAVSMATATVIVPVVPACPVDMTGAGDAMIAGTLHYYAASDDLVAAARRGALIGCLTTETEKSVHPALCEGFVAENLARLEKISTELETEIGKG
ncbi:carbohydrate kinase [Martelella sp. HB161492]|uniref:carbohydrate kinase n=1 Tax=Martelella sp. HB161492 TaxID=2720726 RepID=UPI00158FFE1E|nr:carbohydrate kinase [Martelella sp. HB161492]